MLRLSLYNTDLKHNPDANRFCLRDFISFKLILHKKEDTQTVHEAMLDSNLCLHSYELLDFPYSELKETAVLSFNNSSEYFLCSPKLQSIHNFSDDLLMFKILAESVFYDPCTNRAPSLKCEFLVSFYLENETLEVPFRPIVKEIKF